MGFQTEQTETLVALVLVAIPHPVRRNIDSIASPNGILRAFEGVCIGLSFDFLACVSPSLSINGQDGN